MRLPAFSVHGVALLAGLTLAASPVPAQIDTTRHGWPVTPFFATHPSTGVFGEFRNTLSANHFHNGLDIPKADGSPVYSVYDGVVSAIGTVPSQGDNAYVRVNYRVSGLSKSDAYVHINPNPLLNVGDSVRAYQTVIGTILPGLGHVHFTHGTSPYMNAIRPNGGFSPYTDLYPPDIRFVKFFIDDTENELTGGRVSGRVDIRAHIAETSAGTPGDVTGSTSNNGTYIAGYRILTADRSAVVYEPPDGGVRYRFDRKPSDSYVARVFAAGSDLSTHIYILTNGDGANAINATQVVGLNSWNTALLAPGNYTVMVFAEDTRGLKDTVYTPVTVTTQDLVPPAPPRLVSVVNDSTRRITVRWAQNPDADLLGYRLQFSLDGIGWTTRDAESVLGRGTTSATYRNVNGSYAVYFRLAAVDSAAPPNVSGYSDVYGVRLNTSPRRVLVVDGFDRNDSTASYRFPSHPFAMTHGQSITADFGTAANEAVADSSVALRDYDMAVWVLGDESEADESFNAREQELVKEYLRRGGKLFVSGSEMAFDLDSSSSATPSDRDFLRNFLKARYAGGAGNQFSVYGAAGGMMAGSAFRYGVVAEGSPYEEESPDVLVPEGGSTAAAAHYGTAGGPQAAAVSFLGMVPGGTAPGGVVAMGFPFETITRRGARDSVMQSVLGYFSMTTGAEERGEEAPGEFALEQNYPNPFNPETVIGFEVHGGSLQSGARVRLVVYDLLGREVAVLVDGSLQPGRYSVRWDAGTVAGGVYFYRLQAGEFTQTRRMVVLK
jgi:murein DD-endopeptidase MepM/ murein hydrolase activator NlpD